MTVGCDLSKILLWKYKISLLDIDEQASASVRQLGKCM